MATPVRAPAAGNGGAFGGGGGGDAGADSHVDSSWVEAALGQRRRRRLRPQVDRARSLLLLGLLGAAVVMLWLRLLAAEPHLPVVWRMAAGGGIALDSSADPALQSAIGQTLLAVLAADGVRIEASAALLPRSPRWIVDDRKRQQQQRLSTQLSWAMQQPQVTLQFASGLAVPLAPRPRGLGGLGAVCWLLGGLALALYLAGAVVMLTEPGLPAALYGLLALSQSLNLLLIGAEFLPGMGLPADLLRFDLALRLLADVVAAAALVHVLLLYPRRHVAAPQLAGAAWTLALAAAAGMLLWPPTGLWWWAQGLALAYGLAAAALLWYPRQKPLNPLARQIQRLVLAGTGTLLLLDLAIVTASHDGLAHYHLATIGSAVWVVFFASLLILGPFLSNSRQVLREFTLLAGVSTTAASLGLLFLTVFSLRPLAALVLALAVSLAAYRLARPWILGQLASSGTLSGERLFDSLYRAARAIEQTPEQAARLLGDLLREVFDPLELAHTSRPVSRIRVAADGSTLVVPCMRLASAEAPGAADGAASGAIVLRYAGRGRRLFGHADVQLCERLIEQLRRAVAYDRAVEHGRTEERLRIAQDLHDDIGARLLTLMYKAPNPEIEEYIRHTLQDLKTLTRGLAAANHRLSHAAAEWKSDITQRLNATGCDLRWSFSADRDLMLTMVQWSGLTRVLRELVNNIISHAQATQVEIIAHFDRGLLTLHVSDDGIGRAPEAWSHGLGLGGVRKRVKLLGGQVQWVMRDEQGIRCELRVPLSSENG